VATWMKHVPTSSVFSFVLSLTSNLGSYKSRAVFCYSKEF
jgi:hypothetical protein